MELVRMAQDGVGGSDLLTLRQRLDELTAEQTLLLDKVLEDMDNSDLNAQLKALAEEKQAILEQMAALQEKAERQALQASRRQEMEEWLEQQPMVLDAQFEKNRRCNVAYDKPGHPRKTVRYQSPSLEVK